MAEDLGTEELLASLSSEGEIKIVEFPISEIRGGRDPVSKKSPSASRDEGYNPYLEVPRYEKSGEKEVIQGEDAWKLLEEETSEIQFDHVLRVIERAKTRPSNIYGWCPEFQFPEKIKSLNDISRAFNPKLLKYLYEDVNEGSTFVVRYECCPKYLFLVHSGERGFVNVLSTNVFEIRRDREKVYRRLGYYVGSVDPDEGPFGFVNDEGGRMISYIIREENKAKARGSGVVDESYNQEEVNFPPLKIAKDSMKRKNCSEQSEAFAKTMYRVDGFLRKIITPENAKEVAQAMQAIRRFSMRRGRDETMKCICEMRSVFSNYVMDIEDEFPFRLVKEVNIRDGKKEGRKKILIVGGGSGMTEEEVIKRLLGGITDEETAEELIKIVLTHGSVNLVTFLDEILTDISLDQKYHDGTQIPKSAFLPALVSLLNVERGYLSAIFQYPWNDLGPEPFEALINVFWFRYDFEEFANEYFASAEMKREIIQRLAKKAALRKKRQYVDERIPQGWEEVFASQLDVPIPTERKKEYKKYGSLWKFLTEEERETYKKTMKEARKKVKTPCGLTLLLWKTLRWAQPSPWRMNSIGMGRRGEELWDEKEKDIRSKPTIDENGRITLAGENLDFCSIHDLSHEEKMEERDIIEARLLRAAGNLNSKNVPMSDNVQCKQKIEQAVIRMQNEKPPRAEAMKNSISNFNQTISNISLNELIKRISTLPLVAQLITLNRLGYPGKHKGKIIFESDSSVKYVTYKLLKENSSKYYKSLGMIAEILRYDIPPKELIKALKRFLRQEGRYLKTTLEKRDVEEDTIFAKEETIDENPYGSETPSAEDPYWLHISAKEPNSIDEEEVDGWNCFPQEAPF